MTTIEKIVYLLKVFFNMPVDDKQIKNTLTMKDKNQKPQEPKHSPETTYTVWK